MQSHLALFEKNQLGFGGTYSGNIRRDTFIQFRFMVGVVQPQTIMSHALAIKTLDRLLPLEIDVPINVPNLLFESYWQHLLAKFQACLGYGMRSF